MPSELQQVSIPLKSIWITQVTCKWTLKMKFLFNFFRVFNGAVPVIVFNYYNLNLNGIFIIKSCYLIKELLINYLIL